MCSAIPRRIAFIGWISSPAAAATGSGCGAGAGGCGGGGAGAAAGSGGAGGASGDGGGAGASAGAGSGSGGGGGACAAAGSPDSTKAMMSLLVTRPPRPVPDTCETSTPCSEAIRATTGETNVFSPAPSLTGAGSGAAAGGCGGGCACGGSLRPRRGAGRDGRVLVEDEHLRGLAHALEHRLRVPRYERAQVDDLDRDPVALELLCSLVGRPDH